MGPCRPWRLTRVVSRLESAARVHWPSDFRRWASHDAVEAAIDLFFCFGMVAMGRFRANHLDQVDLFGRQGRGHHVRSLFLTIDLTAVSHNRTLGEISGVIDRVIKVPELLLVPG